MVLNISEFPSTATRVDIAKCVHAKFASHLPVDSIQFVPGGNVQVTFRSSVGKRSVESVETIAIGSVQCRVVRPGPRMENVLVFHYPFESNPSALRRALSSYGEVHDVAFQHYPDLNTVSTGTRIVRMVRKSSIPRSLDIDGTLVKVWYRGQPLECDICGKSGHVSKVCPMKGKCRRCLQPGHLARNCKNPPRAWGAVPSTVSSAASLDPTPAEAAAAAPASVSVRPADVPAAVPDVSASSASSAPASMVIGVYGAEDNWGISDGEMGDASADCNEDSATVVGAVGKGDSNVEGGVGVGEMEVGNGDASSARDEDSAGVVGVDVDVTGDSVADVGVTEASQSVLAEVSPVVDPPGVSDRPPIGVTVEPSSGVANSASADVNVQCQSPVESLQDGQVVNTPLSESQDVSSAPVVTVLEEGDTRPRRRMRWVPVHPYRRAPVLQADGPTKKFLVRHRGDALWVKAVQEIYFE